MDILRLWAGYATDRRKRCCRGAVRALLWQVAGFFLLFLLAGWAYGKGAGTISDHRDLVGMMTGAMEDLAYYLVLAFTAAHFVAMFAWWIWV